MHEWKERGVEVAEVEAWRTCTKKRYDSIEGAYAAVDLIKRYHSAVQEPYICSECEGLHLRTVFMRKKKRR